MVFSRPSADPSSSVPDPIELKLKGANKESHDQVHNLSDSVGNNPENNQKLMGLAQVMAGNLAKDIASMSQPPTMDQLAEMIGKDEAMSGLTPLQQNQLAEYVLSVPVIPVDGGAAPSQTMQASVMPGASFMSSMASGVTSLFKAGDKGESEETEEAHSAETTPSTDPVSAPAEDASTSDGTGESVDENTKNKTTAPEFKKENEAEILAWIESADPKDIAQAMLADFENARTVLPFFPKEIKTADIVRLPGVESLLEGIFEGIQKAGGLKNALASGRDLSDTAMSTYLRKVQETYKDELAKDTAYAALPEGFDLTPANREVIISALLAMTPVPAAAPSTDGETESDGETAVAGVTPAKNETIERLRGLGSDSERFEALLRYMPKELRGQLRKLPEQGKFIQILMEAYNVPPKTSGVVQAKRISEGLFLYGNVLLEKYPTLQKRIENGRKDPRNPDKIIQKFELDSLKKMYEFLFYASTFDFENTDKTPDQRLDAVLGSIKMQKVLKDVLSKDAKSQASRNSFLVSFEEGRSNEEVRDEIIFSVFTKFIKNNAKNETVINLLASKSFDQKNPKHLEAFVASLRIEKIKDEESGKLIPDKSGKLVLSTTNLTVKMKEANDVENGNPSSVDFGRIPKFKFKLPRTEAGGYRDPSNADVARVMVEALAGQYEAWLEIQGTRINKQQGIKTEDSEGIEGGIKGIEKAFGGLNFNTGGFPAELRKFLGTKEVENLTNKELLRTPEGRAQLKNDARVLIRKKAAEYVQELSDKDELADLIHSNRPLSPESIQMAKSMTDDELRNKIEEEKQRNPNGSENLGKLNEALVYRTALLGVPEWATDFGEPTYANKFADYLENEKNLINGDPRSPKFDAAVNGAEMFDEWLGAVQGPKESIMEFIGRIIHLLMSFIGEIGGKEDDKDSPKSKFLKDRGIEETEEVKHERKIKSIASQYFGKPAKIEKKKTDTEADPEATGDGAEKPTKTEDEVEPPANNSGFDIEGMESEQQAITTMKQLFPDAKTLDPFVDNVLRNPAMAEFNKLGLPAPMLVFIQKERNNIKFVPGEPNQVTMQVEDSGLLSFDLPDTDGKMRSTIQKLQDQDLTSQEISERVAGEFMIGLGDQSPEKKRLPGGIRGAELLGMKLIVMEGGKAGWSPEMEKLIKMDESVWEGASEADLKTISEAISDGIKIHESTDSAELNVTIDNGKPEPFTSLKKLTEAVHEETKEFVKTNKESLDGVLGEFSIEDLKGFGVAELQVAGTEKPADETKDEKKDETTEKKEEDKKEETKEEEPAEAKSGKIVWKTGFTEIMKISGWNKENPPSADELNYVGGKLDEPGFVKSYENYQTNLKVKEFGGMAMAVADHEGLLAPDGSSKYSDLIDGKNLSMKELKFVGGQDLVTFKPRYEKFAKNYQKKLGGAEMYQLEEAGLIKPDGSPKGNFAILVGGEFGDKLKNPDNKEFTNAKIWKAGLDSPDQLVILKTVLESVDKLWVDDAGWFGGDEIHVTIGDAPKYDFTTVSDLVNQKTNNKTSFPKVEIPKEGDEPVATPTEEPPATPVTESTISTTTETAPAETVTVPETSEVAAETTKEEPKVTPAETPKIETETAVEAEGDSATTAEPAKPAETKSETTTAPEASESATE